MKTSKYSTSRGRVIFAMPSIASAPWLTVMVVQGFLNGNFDWIPLVLLCVSLVFLWRGLSTCVVVQDDVLLSRGVFKTTKILLSEIRSAESYSDYMVLVLENGERLDCQQIYGMNSGSVVSAINNHIKAGRNAES